MAVDRVAGRLTLEDVRLEAALAAIDRPENSSIVAAVADADGIRAAAVGFADVDEGVLASPETSFALASITKTFTASLILSLTDEGLIDLDAPLSTYLTDPGLPNLNDATVRHALANRSGIGEFWNRDLWASETERGLGHEPVDVWTRVPSPSFPAGSAFEYCNTNWLLLGEVARAVTGSRPGVAIHERLVDPVGLSSLVYQPERAPVRPLAVGVVDFADVPTLTRTPKDGYLPWRSIPSLAGPAGAMAGTVVDLVRWGRLLYTGGVLSARATAAMTHGTDVGSGDRYGLGAWRASFDARIVVGHAGETIGFTAVVFHLPQEDVTIAAAANAAQDPVLLTRTLLRVISGGSSRH